uniref:Solute carrier family 39 member 5 n=1 Tax=Latimeria chalumnae TaxID=7897 RepID=H3A3J3_LATCH
DDASKEQGYYVHQLFSLYGENGTLTFEGLTRLLMNLGLGKVQVVEIEHDNLGHDHMSHLDVLEVQENKHAHSHSALDHYSSSMTNLKLALPLHKKNGSEIEVVSSHTLHQPTLKVSTRPPRAVSPLKKSPKEDDSHLQEAVESLLMIDHSAQNHLHDDVSSFKYLKNRNLKSHKIVWRHFSHCCFSIVYKYRDRFCIYFSKMYTHTHKSKKNCLLDFVSWLLKSYNMQSTKQHTALYLPLNSKIFFLWLTYNYTVLTLYLLCNDLCVPLCPNAQGAHGGEKQAGIFQDSVMKGLTVLGGIYLLFLIESTLGLVRQSGRDRAGFWRVLIPVLDTIYHFAIWTICEPENPHTCDVKRDNRSNQKGGEEGEWNVNKKSIKWSYSHSTGHSDGHSHGHSHNVESMKHAGLANVAWMVIMGDGMHNFTDGLAIGVAFSEGVTSGISTTVAVLCHELPHELGDFAVLLHAGVPVKRVVLFSLMSAVLSYTGMLVGMAVSHYSSNITPWIFAVTAGVFVYVALVDMLPGMLPSDLKEGRLKHFILQNLGFLLGVCLMFCIALFEDQIIIDL